MRSNLPQTKLGIDAFMQGVQGSQKIFDSLMKNRKNPYEIELLKAQAQDAKGSAAKSTMFANLLNYVMGGQPGQTGMGGVGGTETQGDLANDGSPSPSEQSNGMPTQGQIDNGMSPEVDVVNGGLRNNGNPTITPMNENPQQKPKMNLSMANLAAALLGFPVSHTTIDGKLVTSNPLTGTSTEQIGQTPEQQNEQKVDTANKININKNNAAIAKEYDEKAMAGSQTKETLDQLGETINSPTWAGMRKAVNLPIPYAGKAELFYYKKQGTPEQQALASSLPTLTGQVIADSSAQFKGQFRKGEQTLLSGMKINEEDTVAGAQAKLEALQRFTNFLTQRSKIAAKLIRSGVDPSDALDKADKQLNGSLIRKFASEDAKKGNRGKAAKNPLTDEKTAKSLPGGGDKDDAYWNKMMKEAIDNGADPEAVRMELAKIRGY